MPHQCTNCDRTFADGSKEMLSGCPDCGGNKFQFRPASASDGTGSGSNGNEGVAGATTDGASESADTSAEAGRSGVSGAAVEAGSAVRDWVRGSSSDSAGAATKTEPRAWPGTQSSSGSETTRTGPDATGPDTTSPDAASPDAASSDTTSPDTASPDTTAPGATSPDGRAESGDSSSDGEDSAQASARSDVVSPEELSAAAEAAEQETAEPEQPGLSELRKELNDQFESIKIVNPGQYELNLMELYDRDEYIISLREDGRYVIEVPDRWSDDGEPE